MSRRGLSLLSVIVGMLLCFQALPHAKDLEWMFPAMVAVALLIGGVLANLFWED